MCLMDNGRTDGRMDGRSEICKQQHLGVFELFFFSFEGEGVKGSSIHHIITMGISFISLQVMLLDTL